MALSETEKAANKARFERMTGDIEFFSTGTTDDLYAVDGQPMLRAIEAVGNLLVVLGRAIHTRGKQGHGKK